MKQHLKMVWLLSYISIASGSSAMITPALPAIQLNFQLQHGALEWVVAVFLLGYTLGQLIYGPLANSVGRIKALRIGLWINLIGLMLCYLAVYIHNFNFLIIARGINGLGAAGGLSCTFMLINEWLPDAMRKKALSYSVLSFTAAVSLSVIIGGLVTQYWHWSDCFIILMIQGGILLAGTGVFSETLKNKIPLNGAAIVRQYMNGLGSRQLVTFSIMLGCCSAINYCFTTAAPQISSSLMSLSPASYAYWNIINTLGMIVGAFLARFAMERYSTEKVITIGLTGFLIMLMSYYLFSTFSSSVPLWFFMTSALGFVANGFLYSGTTYLATASLEDKAASSSMMSFINMLVSTLAIVILGYWSTNIMQGFIGILTLLVSIILLFLVSWGYFPSKKLLEVRE